jgi:hypothetical protein
VQINANEAAIRKANLMIAENGNAIAGSTQAVGQNRAAIELVSAAIGENERGVRASSSAIEENGKHLTTVNTLMAAMSPDKGPGKWVLVGGGIVLVSLVAGFFVGLRELIRVRRGLERLERREERETVGGRK